MLRFWSKVDKTPGLGPDGDCWEWKAYRDKKSGYGEFWFEGENVWAHRAAWLVEHGTPPTLDVLHRCDNHSCVRPSHLFLGDQLDNARDMVNKDRQAKGEQNGYSKLTEDQVIQIRKSNETLAVLGDRYGVHFSTISKIKLRKNWRHVA